MFLTAMKGWMTMNVQIYNIGANHIGIMDLIVRFFLPRDPVSLWLLNGLTQRRKGKLGKLRKLNHRPLMCLMLTLNALRCLEPCHWVIFHHIMAMVIRSVSRWNYCWASSSVCMCALFKAFLFYFPSFPLLLLLRRGLCCPCSLVVM